MCAPDFKVMADMIKKSEEDVSSPQLKGGHQGLFHAIQLRHVGSLLKILK